MPEDVKSRIFAKDIVREPKKIIGTKTDLNEIIKMFVESNAQSMPVIDSNRRFLGDITVADLIRKGLPDTSDYFEGLDFMINSEDFFENIKVNKNLIAEDIYSDTAIKIEKKTSIMEVGFLLEKYGKEIYVLENEKLIGVISPKDLLSKFINGEEKCF